MNQMNPMNHMDEMGIELPQWVTLPICDKRVSNEVVGEYQLPDYQPEIRRLLSVTPTLLPPAKYVGGSQIELNGTVDYQVLYVGGDGGLYSVPLSAEYNMSVPIEADADVDMGAGVTVFVSNQPENISTRVSAPRKLSIRCRMRSHVCAYGKMLLEERCRGTASPSSIRRRTEQAQTVRAEGALSEPLTLSAELLGVGEDARVISASAMPFVSDTRATDEGVGVDGEVLLKLMIGREDGRVESLFRKLPFSGEVELEEASSEAQMRVVGSVSDLSVNVEEGRILCDVSVLLEARCMRNCPIHYTADLYSTETESQCRTEEYALPVVRKCENTNLSQSERLSGSEQKIPEGAQILDAWGCALWESCENIGGKYVLSGQSKYTLLCRKDEEYSTVEIVLPLRYETDGAEGEMSGFDACAEVVNCRARLDGDVLSLDSELAVIADFWGNTRIAPVVEVEFGDAVAVRECGMTVYYPSPNESVWDVAKKYRISPEQLAEKKGKAAYYLF